MATPTTARSPFLDELRTLALTHFGRPEPGERFAAVAVHSVRSARQPERQVEMTTSCGVKLRQESVSHRRLA